MIEITVGSEWVDGSDGDVLKILVVDGVVLRVESKSDGLCTILASDLLRNFRPKTKGDNEVADMVNHPPHYKSLNGVSCTEVVRHMMFFGGSCFKYLYRCGNKWDDIGDLKKAVRCAEQAKLDNEKVCWSAIIGINTVASVKNKNIGAAMNYISTEDWQWVIVSIKAEIARLESE